jgi:hypothetical protein
MTVINQITFNKRNFSSNETFYSKIAEQIQLLIETGNVISVATAVNEDGTSNDDVVVIKYNPKDPKLMLPYPCWLYPDEIQYVALYHEETQANIYQSYLDEYNKRKTDALVKKKLENNKA